MSYSPTSPFSPEWKPVSQPSCARMPGLFLNKNLNKLQGPAGKTDGSTYPTETLSCSRLLCLPFFSWIWSKLWLKCPRWRVTRAAWERVMKKFPSFSRKVCTFCADYCLWRAKVLPGTAFSPFLLSPFTNFLQKQPAAKACWEISLFIFRHQPRSQVFQK